MAFSRTTKDTHTFETLTDTPSAITASEYVRGNAGGTDLEFRSASEVLGDIGAGTMTSFTVAATATGTGTTITQGDSLTIAAGTGITTTGTSDGVVTIASTVTDTTYTAGDGLTLDTQEFNADLATNPGLKLTASDGSGKLALDLDSLSLDSTVDSTGWSEGDQIAVIDSATTDDPTRKTYLPAEIGIACSDESTAITDSDLGDIATFLIPRKMMLTQIKFSFTLQDENNAYEIDVRYTDDPSSTAPASAPSLLAMQTPVEFPSYYYSTEVSSSGFDDGNGSGNEDSFQLEADSFVVVELTSAESSGEATGLKCWLLGYYN
jgi:hypothetical protein